MKNTKCAITVNILLIHYGLIILLLVWTPQGKSQTLRNQLIFADQRLAVVYPVIQKFKNLITSDPFNVTATWVGTDICSYRGFYCESPPDNISALALASVDFNGFQLTAPTLAGFLDQLPDIALFHANSNNFAGVISPATNLPYLYELDISNNRFSGPFPSAAVLGLKSLSFLDVRFNSFSGAVPTELFAKDGLDALFINDNNFLTKLPDSIGGKGTHVYYLTLANNKFFGTIPHNIARVLSNVSEILLLNNLLRGCVPYELGLLKEAVVIDIGYNRLTGPLPPFSLGCLTKLEILNFAGNLLFGDVPESLCRGFGNLANLSLSDNYFTRVGPACWGLIEEGVLDVRRNCILGLPLQRSVEECAVFFAHPPRYYCPYPHIGHNIDPCWFFPRYKSVVLDDHFIVSEIAPSPS